MLCLRFLLAPLYFESSVACFLLPYHSPHFSLLPPPISLSFFYLAPVSPINKYSWTSGIFVFVWCSQSDIAQGIIECASHLWAKGPDMYSRNNPWGCELKLLDWQKRRRKKKQDGKKLWSFDSILSKRKEQAYSIWAGFKVFLEMLEIEDTVGHKCIFSPLFRCSRAARWDLTYLQQLVHDLCSNGILIDTGGADDILEPFHWWQQQQQT